MGGGQTARNSGVVHAGLYYAPGSLKARLCREGMDALYRYCAERGIEHRIGGKLVVAVDRVELPRLGALEELAGEEKVREAVQKEIDAANEKLSRVEQVKKFHLVSGDWVPGGDELTPTMKLKRKPIAEKYADEIEALYAG